MFHFPDPAQAVLAGLVLVERVMTPVTLHAAVMQAWVLHGRRDRAGQQRDVGHHKAADAR